MGKGAEQEKKSLQHGSPPESGDMHCADGSNHHSQGSLTLTTLLSTMETTVLGKAAWPWRPRAKVPVMPCWHVLLCWLRPGQDGDKVGGMGVCC